MADEELSDSDSDDFGLREDMEALRRACSFSTRDHGGSSGVVSDDSSSESSDVDDDLELYRNIKEKFSVGGADHHHDHDHEPLNLRPICVLPPLDSDDDDDDCDGDFEILKDIQRRFTDTTGNEHVVENVINDVGDFEILKDIQRRFTDTTGNEHVVERVENVEDVINDVGDLSVREEDVGLPKAAQAILDAIKKNRVCQKYMRSKLMHVESRIEENVKLRNRVKALKGLQFCCRRRSGLELSSHKKDGVLLLVQVTKLRVNARVNDKSNRVMRCSPCENPHVLKYKAMLEKFSESVNRDKWTKKDDVNLVKGVKQQFQDMLLQKTYEIAEGFSGSNDVDSIIASISDHDITDENLKEFLPNVNWEQLASMYTKGRSGAECEARWLNCTDPLINKKLWTKTEEKKLLYTIQHKGISNWIDIAASLGTNRTPFQCLAHYQRSLNPSILKRDWTEDEDDKLRAAVATYGESNWESVASVLEGRTGTQCSNRWTKSLHPTRKRIGKWAPNEDKRLKVAIMFFGAKNWRTVAQYVPGRDHVQCRERWSNSLDPRVKLDYWSLEEDQRLEEAFEEFGPSWNKIASYVTQRTDNQCLRRWKILFPHEFLKLQVARKIKKIALPSNFVDRDARRPALGPSDFVHLQLLDSVPAAKKMVSCGKRKRTSRKPVSSANSYVSKLRSAKHKKDAQKSCEADNPLTPEVHTDGKKAPVSRKRKTRKLDFSESITVPGKADTKNTRKPSSCEREIDATKNRKRLKPSGKKNKLTEQVKEAQVLTESDGTDVNKKSGDTEPSLSVHSDLSIPGDCPLSPGRSSERMLTNGDDNAERPLRCSTPEILDNLNSREITVCRKRPRGRNFKQIQKVGYRDDMKVPPVSSQSRRTQKVPSSPRKNSKLLPPKCATSAKMVDVSKLYAITAKWSASELAELDTSSESVIGEHQRSKRLKNSITSLKADV